MPNPHHKRQGSGRGGQQAPQADVAQEAEAIAAQRRAPPRVEHQRAEGHEHPEAHPGRQGAERARRDGHAQAGAHLPDPEGADRAERVHLLGRRPRSAARRLRLPPRARLQLPARARRHLRLALADPQVRSADRRHRLRPDSPAEGRGALLRAHQSRGGQLRGARTGARQAVLREPHAALSAGAHQARNRDRKPLGARHGPDDAHRQRAARAHRRAAAHRQDDAAAEHRAVGRQEPPRGLPRSSCSSTSGRKKSPTCSGRWTAK